jgi:hypothetical protein
MCRNGQYTERGIKQIHGYMSERWRTCWLRRWCRLRRR